MEPEERPLIVHTGDEVATALDTQRQAQLQKPIEPAASKVLEYTAKSLHRETIAKQRRREGETFKAILAALYFFLTAFLWITVSKAGGLAALLGLFGAISGTLLLWLAYFVQCYLISIIVRANWPLWSNLLITLILGPGIAVCILRFLMLR